MADALHFSTFNEVGSQRGSSTTDPEEGFHRFSKAMDFSTRSVSDVSSYLFLNRTGPFQGIRLSGSAIHPPWSCAASTATQVLTLCITLGPFPVSWALPQAFEYYGSSVTVGLSTLR